MITELKFDSKFTGTFIGQFLKYIEGHYVSGSSFNYDILYGLFKFIKSKKLEKNILYKMLPIVYQQPQMDFESILEEVKYKKHDKTEILAPIDFLREKYKEIGRKQDLESENNWIMGELRQRAIGNMSFAELKKELNNQNTDNHE